VCLLSLPWFSDRLWLLSRCDKHITVKHRLGAFTRVQSAGTGVECGDNVTGSGVWEARVSASSKNGMGDGAL